MSQYFIRKGDTGAGSHLASESSLYSQKGSIVQ